MQSAERPIDDLALACAAHNGAADWSELVARLQPTLARAAYRQARRWNAADPATVEDLVQAAFARLSTHIHAFQPQAPDSFLAFATTLAHRVALDHFKATARHKRGAGTPDLPLDENLHAAAAGPDPDDTVLLRELEDYVRQTATGPALARDLIVFQLYYRLGLTAAAIASLPALELGPRQVESVLDRLLRQLRLHFAARAQFLSRKASAHSVNSE